MELERYGRRHIPRCNSCERVEAPNTLPFRRSTPCIFVALCSGEAHSDILLSSLLILLFFPVMLAVAIAVALTSPGPIFFTQERLGRFGAPLPHPQVSLDVYAEAEAQRQCVRD